MMIYGVYLGARLYGFHYDNADALSLGADWLAIGMFPALILMATDRGRSGDDVPTIGFRDSGQ